MALWHEGPYRRRCQKQPDPATWQPPRPMSTTSIKPAICCTGKEFVFGDAGYQRAPSVRSWLGVKVEWGHYRAPGKVKALSNNVRHKNKAVIPVEDSRPASGAKVEHPFRLIKRQFEASSKRRYKGLMKERQSIGDAVLRWRTCSGVDREFR